MKLPPGEHGEEKKGWLTVSNVLTGLAAGTISVILAPHLLPAIGIGSETLGEEAALMLGHRNVATGAAGAINGLLKGIPFLGGKLAGGGVFCGVVSGILGIGGVLLGNYISKKEEGKEGFKWGKLIKYAAIATSALIALPTALTSLGTGIIYLAALAHESGFLATAATSAIVGVVAKTIGTIGGIGQHVMMGLSGFAAAIPHFFTCGVAMLPTALSMTALKTKPQIQAGDGITLEILPDAPLEAGKQCTAKIRLKNERAGRYLTADDLTVVHTEKLHLLVVDESLQDCHHIHPKQTAEEGVFTLQFTPRTANNYTAWADFTTARDDQNHRISCAVESKSHRHVPARVDISQESQAGGLDCAWESNAPLRQGQDTLVHIDVRDSAGNPVNDLEPIMGAYAHLVGFGADGKTLIHAHPIGEEPTSPDDRGGPRLSFHVAPESAGETQFYLQLKRGGQEVTLPFGQRIAPPSAAVEKAMHTIHAHAHAR